MMRAIELFCVVFWCLCAATWASTNREPCQSPSMTSGTLSVSSTGGHDIAEGHFNYNSTAKRLRFVENESHSHKTSHMDVLIHFEEGVLYEIDIKNESCKKQTLKYHRHPMELPSDTHYESEAYLGSPTKSEQGLRVRMWNGKLPDLHANYTMLTTSCGCLTVSYCYHSEKTDLYFSFMNVETEVDDAHVFAPPAYCDGVALEDTPDDHSFFDLFHD
ncbi:ependymin-like [Pygocentrus nattereri]|uniref:Ependymin n=1 Tax=Pygocentrus nattereri TaxID=42514 RepID=A0A3B4C211_PYGNA|nr:ependymin-like [Pygocentrus nattereri]